MSSGISERRAIFITGMVQGVGFRPFVFRLAARHRLKGFVKNQSGGVCVEAEGAQSALDTFLNDLSASQPPQARIESIRTETRRPGKETDFQIIRSEGELADPDFLPPDIATCPECLEELFDPKNRRHGYAFISCALCGPRLTVIRGAPYDRERTTMSAFTLCPQCRAEYENPSDRRFRAETTCCPVCGPKLQFLDRQFQPVPSGDPIALAAQELRAGCIGAVKGLGGFHLVCDARNDKAVAELRRRKSGSEKPFAIMVADLAAAAKLCEVDAEEQKLLSSPQRPIVLLRKRPPASGNPWEGVMLPYTPLHHLLLKQLGDTPLIITSGNRDDEPIAFRDGRLSSTLAGLSDFCLTHNRNINVRCGDSVARVAAGRRVVHRRARGYAPAPVALPIPCPVPILAVGGQTKSACAFGRGRHAILTQHIGELDQLEAFEAFGDAIRRYEPLFGFEPKLLAHDLQPDFAATTYAMQRAKHGNLRTVSVQHHHAHIASCMAENGVNRRVIGVAFDDAGHGSDGAVWGGEFLLADFASFERAAHLRYVAIPGSHTTLRQPWRMAVSHLLDAGERTDSVCDEAKLAAIKHMIGRGFNTPPTSSCGRLFDSVAVMLGLRHEAHFAGQAAMELEWLAMQAEQESPYPIVLEPGATIIIDTRPVIAAVARDLRDGVAKDRIAGRFHATIVDMIVTVCLELRERSQLNDVVLSGGVFLNSILQRDVPARLRERLFDVHQHGEIPPNDGGLCLGQLAVAAAQSATPPPAA
jgi:hydrogenase maturation protein HypF